MKKTTIFSHLKNQFVLFLLVLSILPLGRLTGQEDSVALRPVQLTLLYPLGTNGLNSPNIDNIFSMNLIAGYTGGVRGLELGGFANLVRNDMYGAQFSGFANIVNGRTYGAQFAGFMNLNNQHTGGIQAAGFMNIVSDEIDAVQLAGFANIAGKRKVKMEDEHSIIRMDSHSRGLQLAGFANVTSSDITALQSAGFVNIVNGNLRGAQLSGFLNYVEEDADGFQLGVVNYGKRIKGMQLGVFNVADTIESGLAFGVLSYVKSGYQAFEIAGTETIHGVLSFKTGTRKFYNILSVGTTLREEKAWAFGYGIGSYIPISKRLGLSLEAQSFHLNEGEIWTNELNMLNKLGASLSYDFADRFSVFGGASYNVTVSKLKDEEGNVVGSSLVPWYSFDETHGKVNIKMYAGFSFGVRMEI